MVRLRSCVAGAGVALALAGCLFPEYTFDEPEPSGGSGGASTNASSSTTGTPASTTTSASVSGGGGQGGMAPTEDCFAPGDEDADQLEDCADPDCEPDVECVDAIPVGWGGMGYVALFHGGMEGSDPECPPGTGTVAYNGNTGLSNTNAQCTACGCAAPAWESCQFSEDLDTNKAGLQAIYPGNQTCGAFTFGVTLTVPSPWAVDTCSAIDTAAGGATCSGSPCNSFVDVAQAKPSNGTCTPTGGNPSNGDPVWQDVTKACRTTRNLAGCTAPQACVPKPKGEYEPRICIGRAGEQACPGAFTEQTVSYGGFFDDRGCTDCTCGAGAGGACTLGVTLYSDAACMNQVATGNSNTCINLGMTNPTIAGRKTTVVTPPTGGSCPSTGGGVPSGGVTETDPTTFCCLP